MKRTNKSGFRALLIFLAVLTISHIVSAQSIKNYNFKFSENDFQFVIENELTQIKSIKHRVSLLEDSLKPAIPYITANILLPANSDISSVEYNVLAKKELGTHNIAFNPRLSIQNGTFQFIANTEKPSIGKYPLSQIENYSLNLMDGYRIASIRFSPFIYDAESKALTLITNFDLNINMKTSPNPSQGGGVMRNVVKKTVCNSEELEMLYPLMNRKSISMRNNFVENKIDYLIITADSLKDSFAELKDWNLYKGIRTEIVSIEDIYNSNNWNYDDSTLILKRYIYTKYLNGLKSVLLAGDCNLVPTKYCYGEVPNLKEEGNPSNELPTDLFYACFDNTFNWNYNNNNKYGEVEDNIDISQDIFISRLPVKNKLQADGYINKLLNYEKHLTDMNTYAKKTLFAGSYIFSGGVNGVHHSDTHNRGDLLYETYIASNDSIPYNYLYDTGSSFEDEEIFSANELQSVLSKGYNIIHLDAHGDFDKWKKGDYSDRADYTTDYASELESPCAAVIISSACFVSDFAEESMCLGEAFICNPKSGNIAFIGNSDYGLCTYSESGSLWINREFLRLVYQEKMDNLGEIIATIKQSKASNGSTYGVDRWLTFVLNPFGDTNFQLNITGSSEFDNVKIYLNEIDGHTVNTGIEDCTITLIQENEYGLTSVVRVDNLQEYTFTGYSGGKYTFCINKSGYKTFISDVNTISDFKIQATEFIANNKFLVKDATIGSDVIPEVESKIVEIQQEGSLYLDNSGTVTITKGFNCEKGGTLIINPQ